MRKKWIVFILISLFIGFSTYHYFQINVFSYSHIVHESRAKYREKIGDALITYVVQKPTIHEMTDKHGHYLHVSIHYQVIGKKKAMSSSLIPEKINPSSLIRVESAGTLWGVDGKDLPGVSLKNPSVNGIAYSDLIIQPGFSKKQLTNFHVYIIPPTGTTSIQIYKLY